MNDLDKTREQLREEVSFLRRRLVQQEQAQKAIHKSEASLRALIEHGWDGLALADANGVLSYLSATAVQMLGYQAAELAGRHVLDLMHPADQERTTQLLGMLLQQSGASVSTEFRYRHQNGSWLWIEGTGTNLLHHPDVQALVLNFRDVTDRKCAAQAIAERERLFHAVIEAARAVPYTRYYAEEKFAYLGPGIQALVGYTPEQLTLPLWRSLVQEVLPCGSKKGLSVAEATEWLRNEASPTWWADLRVCIADGSERWLFNAAVKLFDERGQLIGSMGLLQDVTERKRDEQGFQQRERQVRAILENSPECVKVVAPDGTLLQMNGAGLAMIEADSAADVVGQKVFALIAPKHRGRYRTFHEQVCRGEKGALEFEIVGLKGTVRTVESRAVPLPDENGQILHLAITRDITEQKRLEAQFRQAQKMEAVGRLAGGIAHEFNNLLTVINGFSDLLVADASPESPALSSLLQIQGAGQRAAALTKQLLAYSRKQILQPKILDLNALVLDMTQILRFTIGEDIELVTELEPHLGAMLADPNQLEQVLMNLVVNARDAMSQGGRLTLTTRNCDLDESCLREHPEIRPGRYVTLAVADTGCGMDKETKGRIFEPFFTTKEVGKGTGLGLSTVYGIIKQSDGFIYADSAPGQGTTFRVYLPRIKQVPEAEDRVTPANTAPGTETILLAEDEDTVRILARTILRRRGYTVLEAHDGPEALALAEQHPGPIHLLVADVVMPRMSGGQLAQQLTALRPEMKVLYLTGYTDDAVIRRGVQGESVALLQKPFLPDALTQNVRAVLDG